MEATHKILSIYCNRIIFICDNSVNLLENSHKLTMLYKLNKKNYQQKSIFWVFIFYSFINFLPLKAQTLPPANPKENKAENLSLAQAIEKTLAQNFDIVIQQEQIKVSQYNNHWANAGKYPTINFALNQNNSLNNIIKPAPFQLQGIIINNGVVPTMSLNWLLFNGFGIRIAKTRLALLEKQSQGNAALTVQNTLQSVIVNYYQIKLLEGQSKLLAKVMELSRQKYEYTKFKKQVGSAIASDIWLEENNYLSDSAAYINQQLNVRNAARNLNVLMAEKDVEKHYNFTDTLALDNTAYQFEDLQQKMLSNNQNLRNQLLAQEILQNNIASAKAMTAPTLSLSAASTYSWAFQNLDNARQVDGTSAGNRTGSVIGQNNVAGFVFSVPVFGGGQLKRNVQEAKMQAKIGELQTEQLKLRLSNVLQQALDQYQVRKQLHTIAEQNQKLAYQNLNLSAEKFRTGKINTFEYRILQENYFVAASSALLTLYQVLETHTQLAVLTGSILEEK